MKILCVSYREWALEIYKKLKKIKEHDILIIRSKSKYSKKIAIDYNPDMILFYGWSWKVEDSIINSFPCVMLHPSPLPKYRGGSPIQNQIINGEKISAVTLFLMDSGIDSGPILKQQNYSLEGNLKDIFERIIDIGFKLTKELFHQGFQPIDQEHQKATFYKRRTPDQSEITLTELKTKSAEYLYNKIRMLQDPYPNAFIVTSDGEKLSITLSSIDK